MTTRGVGIDALCLEVEGAPEQQLEFIGIQRVTVAA
jgi:hypothetical protein